jgi:hypothetical protein
MALLCYAASTVHGAEFSGRLASAWWLQRMEPNWKSHPTLTGPRPQHPEWGGTGGGNVPQHGAQAAAREQTESDLRTQKRTLAVPAGSRVSARGLVHVHANTGEPAGTALELQALRAIIDIAVCRLMIPCMIHRCEGELL